LLASCARRERGPLVRSWLKRLEREARGELVEIPQHDGTVARFPRSALRDAYANHMARMGGGEDAPPEHPLIEAARNSSAPKWSNSFFAPDDPEEWTKPVPDLSEPGPEE
jgi:hypothetical protein